MSYSFSDIRSLTFAPLSEIKAKLSEKVRDLAGRSRIAITTNGRPTAVLLSYADYLALLPSEVSQNSAMSPNGRAIDFDEWRRSRPQRRKVSESIRRLFIPEKLSRKGRKGYKEETLRAFSRRS